MKLQLARGVRDIPVTEQMKREQVIQMLKETFGRFGFLPLDTPIIERYDVLSAKFAAGEESDAMSETYRLSDNGGRKLGLRFDLTVPLARFVGMNKELKMPFKRYQIGKVYRDAPVKEGRYREFTQCDVDIVGTKSMMADATCISVAQEVYTALGITPIIKVNNRKVLQGIIRALKVSNEKAESAMITLDKLDKYGKEAVQKELTEKGISIDVNDFLSLTPGTCVLDAKELEERFLKPLEKTLGKEHEGLLELRELFSYFPKSSEVIFDPALARGLGYYTGSVFEVYAKDDTAIGAIGAGGRYDNLIGDYLGEKGGAYPAVGISFGLDRMMDVLRALKQEPVEGAQAQLFIIPIGETKKECYLLAQTLRKKGLRVDVDLSHAKKGISKNIRYADAYNIPYALFVGEDEIAKKSYTLKNLATGVETSCALTEISKTLSR